MMVNSKVITFLLLVFFTVNQNANSQLPFPKKPVVIYDNDDHRDVYTDEFLMALSHLKKVRLKAFITTYPHHEYPLFVKGRDEIIELADQSGLKNLPVYLEGTDETLKMPESKRISDTEPLAVAASNYIVKRARQHSRKNPLVLITGGSLTTFANALLLDPSISNKIIVTGVFGCPDLDYNAGLDPWAWSIVMNSCRVVSIPIGPTGNRAEVYMKAAQVEKDEIKNQLNQNVPLFKWMLIKHHPGNDLPNGHDFDGQPLLAMVEKDYITEITRYRCTGVDEQGKALFEKDPEGKIYVTEQADQEVATDYFWKTFTKTQKKIKTD